jgi:hypothetical protein
VVVAVAAVCVDSGLSGADTKSIGNNKASHSTGQRKRITYRGTLQKSAVLLKPYPLAQRLVRGNPAGSFSSTAAPFNHWKQTFARNRRTRIGVTAQADDATDMICARTSDVWAEPTFERSNVHLSV